MTEEKKGEENSQPDTANRAACSKRRFLTAATTVVGAVGAGFVAVPFIRSLEPDAEQQAGSVSIIDISGIAPGGHIVSGWQQKPVIIANRTPEMLATLKEVTPRLLDPNNDVPQQPLYAKNIYRARKPEWLVMMLVCTHLCCTPLYRPKKGSVSPDWLGGFHCPCHGSLYDLSGRVFTGVPAPRNMVIPEYEFINGGKQVKITGINPKSKFC